MNDVGYVTSLKYKDSYAEASVKTADKDQLKNLKYAYEGAVEYHGKENNQSQFEFFTEGLNLVNKRLKRL